MRMKKGGGKTSLQVIPEELKEVTAMPERSAEMKPGDVRALLFTIKGIVWKFERENLAHLVVYHREGKWWQMGDNSMLIYYNWAVKQLGLVNTKIRHDRDFQHKWKYGYITVNNIEKLMERLTALDYKLVADRPEIKIFELSRAIRPDEMEIWRNSEAEKEKRFNALVVPKNIYPNVTSKAAILHREVINKVVNLASARQKYYGDEGAEHAAWLSLNAIKMANGRVEPIEYFEEALQRLDALNDWLAYVKKFDLFPIDTGIRIMEQIKDLKTLVEVELAALKRNKRSDTNR